MALVTIGMPVHNEGAFLGSAIDSLLAQDFPDFELLISDNASTDATPAIATAAARRDTRVHHLRSSSNRGAFANFQVPLELAQTKYFMWAAGHDLWDPTFLRRCVAILEGDDRVGLCYPRTLWIDAEGGVIRESSDGLQTTALTTISRFNTVMWRVINCTAVYGVFRTEDLRKAKVRSVFGGDLILLTELSAYCRFAEIPEPLFHRRVVVHEDHLTEKKRRYDIIHPSGSDARWRLPYWEFVAAHVEMTARLDVGLPTRAVLLASAALALPVRYHRWLLDDLVHATPVTLRRFLPVRNESVR